MKVRWVSSEVMGWLTMLPASVEPRAQTKTTFAQRRLRENSCSVMEVRSRSWRGGRLRGTAAAVATRERMEKSMVIVGGKVNGVILFVRREFNE
jgi:hypothetical protein